MAIRMRYAPYEFDKEDAYRFANSQYAKTRERGGELFFYECPFCHSKKDHWTFSISMEGSKKGTYYCFRASCQAGGNMITLSQVFDNFSIGTRFNEYFEPHPEKYVKYNTPKEPIKPTSPAISYLKMRGISEKTAKKYEITTKVGQDNVLEFDFFDQNGTLRCIKYRKTDFLPGRDKDKEWFDKEGDKENGKSGMPILFGIKQCDTSSRTLIVTEGQLDSLSVAEAGYNNAVSVPTGAGGFTWVSHCWDWVTTNFDRIIVFGDHEKGKITLVDDFRKYFTRMDVMNVRPTDYKDCKDANDILRKYGKDQIKVCIENAVSAPIPHVISLADVLAADNNSTPKLATGFKPLDKLLHGGLPFGGLTVITAKRGEGKSTLASQILLRGASDDNNRCFAYSGEMGASQFKTWMDRQAAGRKFIYAQENPFGYIDYTISNKVGKAITEWYRDRIDFYDINAKFDSDNAQNLIDVCEKEIVRNNANILLIDNLMTAMSLQNISGSDKYEKQGRFVNDLAQLAASFNCVVLLVAHKRKNAMGDDENDEIAGSADISNLAMVTLSYDRSKDIDANDRLLKISKNRIFGEINTEGWTVHYDPASKRIYCDGDDLDFEVGWNSGSYAEKVERGLISDDDEFQ